MGLGSGYMALSPSLLVFFITAAIVGFSGGGYDTAQIVWIIELWSSKAAPYIQTQHFSFAIGTLISPLLIKPYLSNDPDLSAFTQNSTDSGEHYPGKQLYIPFFIGGAASILGGLFLLALYFFQKSTSSQPDGTTNVTSEPQNSPENSTSRKILLISLSAIVIGTYCGMELCTIQFLPSFTHFISLHLSPGDGALVLSSLTGAFTLGRGLGICLVLKIHPEILLLANLCLITVGNSVLYFWANDSYPMLWTGSICMGIGFSTVFPSFYGYIEKHLVVSNVVGAIMIMAGGLVSSLYPVIIGSFIESNPYVLMYTNYFSLVVSCGAFLCIYCTTQKSSKSVERQCQPGSEESRNGYVAGKEEVLELK
jgi:FHS family Na+ dependent glucose MFS transporter 1